MKRDKVSLNFLNSPLNIFFYPYPAFHSQAEQPLITLRKASRWICFNQLSLTELLTEQQMKLTHSRSVCNRTLGMGESRVRERVGDRVGVGGGG